MKPSKKVQEMRVYGRHACLKLHEKRPQDIIRAYVTQETLFEMRPIIRHCVDHKLAYHVVTTEELSDLTRATHHEGVALVVRNKKFPTLSELFQTKGRNLILALEGVQNPHNLGAIMRTAAHFGVSGILYEAKVPVALTGAAYRTSEGGAESVPALHLSDWKETFELAKKNKFGIFATSSHQGKSLFETSFSEKTLLFMGAEGEGLSSGLLKKIEQHIQIPGTGAVESLNVSNATTALLVEWYRQGKN